MSTTTLSPLVSVFTPVKNAEKTIKRCIESILSQDYSNTEIVVQDGNSTDKTLEILNSFTAVIKLVSESDTGPMDGFYRAIKRCRGDIIIACLSDEELTPGAISWGVNLLSKNTRAAAVYGDIYSTDINGNIVSKSEAKRWNFKKVFYSEYFPYFCAAFFRKKCIDEVKLPLDSDAFEFGLWWRLGARYEILYESRVIAKFALHINQLSENIDRYTTHLPGRIEEIEYLAGLNNCHPILKKGKEKAISGCYLFNSERLLLRHTESYQLASQFCVMAQKHHPDFTRLAKQVSELNKAGIQVPIILTGWSKILFSITKLCMRPKIWLKYIVLEYRIINTKTIAVFGAWPGSKSIINECIKRNINVSCFVDNSKDKQGTTYLDIPVYPVEFLLTDEAKEIQAVIIASDESRNEMIAQLKQICVVKRII